MPQSKLIFSAVWLSDAWATRRVSDGVRDADDRCKDQLSIVVLLHDKQSFGWMLVVTVILDMSQPAAMIHRLIGTRGAWVDHRGACRCSRGWCHRGRVFGADMQLEWDGLYCRVGAVGTAIRLLTGVTHTMTSQGVVVTRRVRTHVTPAAVSVTPLTDNTPAL